MNEVITRVTAERAPRCCNRSFDDGYPCAHALGVRVAWAILSVFVLVAIAAGSPSIAHARALDQWSDVAADDVVDADLLACFPLPEPVVEPVIRSFVMVDVDGIAARAPARSIAILVRAPKTSPPALRS